MVPLTIPPGMVKKGSDTLVNDHLNSSACAELVVNPLTAARAYRELGEYTETRRGIGLVVKRGVRNGLLRRERQRFLKQEWPAMKARIDELDLDLRELLDAETGKE